MATFRLKRFAKLEALKKIRSGRLIELLRPYASYLGPRIDLTASEAIDCDALSRILMDPKEGIPPEMVDALYHIDEMATQEGMDALDAAATKAKMRLDSFTPGGENAPADVAVEVWLLDKEMLLAAHAEQHITNPRSFEYFQAAQPHKLKFLDPTKERLARLEADLDVWFNLKNRGTGAKVFVFPREDAVWLLIRHGGPLKREGSLTGGVSSSICFRPETFDTVVYDPHLDEIRLKACGVGEKQMLLQQIGLHLFGDKEYFPSKAKFTVEPLREQGQEALACKHIEGMEDVVLTEIQYYLGASDVVIYRSKDLLSTKGSRGHQIYPKARIASIKLQVKFTDSKTPRTVTIRPPNISSFARDEDSEIIDQWMLDRGFSTRVTYADEDA